MIFRNFPPNWWDMFISFPCNPHPQDLSSVRSLVSHGPVVFSICIPIRRPIPRHAIEKKKLKMEIIKINTNPNNNHQKLKDIFFWIHFLKLQLSFYKAQHVHWRSSPHWGDHHKSSSTKPWMRSSQHPAELLTQGHFNEEKEDEMMDFLQVSLV